MRGDHPGYFLSVLYYVKPVLGPCSALTRSTARIRPLSAADLRQGVRRRAREKDAGEVTRRISAEEASYSEVHAPSSGEAPRTAEDSRSYQRVHHDTRAAVRSVSGVLPIVEGVAVLEPCSCEHRSANEAWQTSHSPEVSACRDVVVVSPELASPVCAEPKRHAQGELVGWKRGAIERRTDTAIHKHTIARPSAPELVRIGRQLRERRLDVGRPILHHDIGSIKNVPQPDL